jgi:5-methylcytosine-specific restriction endonuclease McrA
MSKQSALRANGSTYRWRQIRQRVLARDNYLCYYCGSHANTVDHVVPRRLGGDDSLDNLLSACSKCNSRKGGRFFESAPTPPTPHGLFMPENTRIDHFQAG